MTNNQKIYFLIAFISFNFSCSKFEDGPKISLLPKKTRISRDWKVEYSINLATNIEHSADFADWLLSIDKNGSFTNTVIYNSVKTTYNGSWEFIGNNQIRYTFSTLTGDQIEFYTILRLSRKEFWVKNEYEEIHYYSG